MPRCLQCRQKFADPLTAVNFYREPEILCEKCREGWEQCLIFNKKKLKNMDEESYCKKCLKPLTTHETKCGDCMKLAQHFTLINQLYCEYYNKGIIKDVFHQYRNGGDVALCEVIAAQIHFPKKRHDYIVPIPMSAKDDVKSTFNPVIQVLKTKKIPFVDLFGTTGQSESNIKHQTAYHKKRNLFYLTPEAQALNLENKTILLVNDIYTTGVTEHQAAEKLFIRKIGKVDVFTFAR